MTDVKFGILLWSQAASWNEMLDAAKRVDRLGYAHLWTWDHLYAIFGDPYQPIFEGWSLLDAWARETEQTRLGLLVGANTFRNPGIVAKTADDARPRERRPGDPRHRRRLDGARAPGPRHRLRVGLRPAARLARRVCRPRCGALLDGESVTSRAGRPLCVRRPAPRAAARPAAPADHDRRQRREEDASDRRPLRRPVERDGPARRDAPQDRGPAPATARPSGATSPRSSSRSGSRPRSATARPRPTASGRPRWSTTGRRWRTSSTTTRSGTGRPTSSPSGSRRTSSSGSGRSSASSRRRTTPRRSSGCIGEVGPLIEGRVSRRPGAPGRLEPLPAHRLLVSARRWRGPSTTSSAPRCVWSRRSSGGPRRRRQRAAIGRPGEGGVPRVDDARPDHPDPEPSVLDDGPT